MYSFFGEKRKFIKEILYMYIVYQLYILYCASIFVNTRLKCVE